MKSNIIFRMVAYTDAAGKFSVDAPRNGNEDNFFFAYDLSKDAPSKGEPDVDTQMSECGLLMVVADGMGGMNAGEVASQIAVDTVAEFFAPGKITPEFAKDHQKRKKYMEHVISEADIRIKKDSKHDSEHKGMGSTIIMAWIVGDELTLSWCGDSRAYRFNPACGIEPLSRDHSYVQELADKGIIKYEDTFDHPQGNIVTRSLGDVSKKAIPETELFKVYNDDIILLCSDGLSGVLRDKKSYDMDGELIEGENLEDIISTNRETLKGCREALWKAAEKADWYDNVTAVLCEIRSGAGTYVPTEKKETPSQRGKTLENNISKTFKGINIQLSTKGILFSIIGLLCFVCITFFAAWKILSNRVNSDHQEAKVDSTIVEKQDIVSSGNKGLDFIKAQSALKLRLSGIQEELSLQSNDPNINSLTDLIENAKDSVDLSKVEKKIVLLEQKLPYLKKVNMERTNNASNKAVSKSLLELYNKIVSSQNVDGNNWKKELKKILETKGSGTKLKEDVPAENPEITEIVDMQEYIVHDAIIQRGNTYAGLISSLERNKYPNYFVSIIKDKNTGRTLFSRNNPQDAIDINMAIGHNVEITLLRK